MQGKNKNQRFTNSLLNSQYTFLKIYSFFWWAFYSMVFVFNTLYFKEIGIELNVIFLNSALSVIFSMFVINGWSKLSDKMNSRKPFIILGNVFFIASFLYLPFVNSIFDMFIYTIIFYSAPSSDSILISYIYKISDYTNPNISNNRPIYNKIRTYAYIRKYGSIGWASMLPISGIIIDNYGYQVNFLASAIFMLILTIIFALKFNENVILELNGGKSQKNEKWMICKIKESSKSSLIENLRIILKNPIFSLFIIVSFIAAISNAMSTTVFSIFNSKFSQNSYLLLGLTWSINAYIEYPVMNIASKTIEKYKWYNIVVFTNFILMFRLLLNPLLLLFDGTIYWIYVFQILNGINFGLNWPATTYGLNSNLDEDQKSLGMTFFTSIRLAGNLVGNLLGSLVAFLIPDENTFYYILYVLAAFFLLLSSLLLFIKMKKHESNHRGGLN